MFNRVVIKTAKNCHIHRHNLLSLIIIGYAWEVRLNGAVSRLQLFP
jgi:hypothetical protein